jgi:hypothetical protein
MDVKPKLDRIKSASSCPRLATNLAVLEVLQHATETLAKLTGRSSGAATNRSKPERSRPNPSSPSVADKLAG